MPRQVQFFYAIGSRYAYLAATQLEQFARQHQAELEWLPLDSVRLLEERGYSPFEHVEIVRGQYSPDYRQRDAERWARLYGVPFHEPRGRLALDSDLLARAATAGKLLGADRQLSLALFAAVFHGKVRSIDQAECVRQAVAVGLDAAEFVRLDADAAADALDETMLRAHVAGVFGVPTFVADGEQFWGNDRLPLLASHLASQAK